MKKCNSCGMLAEDQSNSCSLCGSSDFSAITNEEQAQNNPSYSIQNEHYNETDNEYENIVAGIVGAFLFSIIGGLLYFVIYQMDIIAGICGLAIFVLANFGYGLFSKTKNKNSMVGLVVSILAMIVMIFLAECFCLSYEVFQEFKGYGVSIFDAIKATPEYFSIPEIREAVIKDLAFAYGFGFLASISNIVNIFKARKN